LSSAKKLKLATTRVGLVFLWGAFLTIGVVIGVILRKRVSTSSDHPSHPPDTPIE
jgi:hypothetical protein